MRKEMRNLFPEERREELAAQFRQATQEAQERHESGAKGLPDRFFGYRVANRMQLGPAEKGKSADAETLLIQHRGIFTVGRQSPDGKEVAFGVPENTSAAVISAWSQGYPVELDVRRTQDGEIVAFHDGTVGRMLYMPASDPSDQQFVNPANPQSNQNPFNIDGSRDPQAIRVENLDLQDLRKCGLRDPSGRPTPYRVETLKEVLETLSTLEVVDGRKGISTFLTYDCKKDNHDEQYGPITVQTATILRDTLDLNGVPYLHTGAIKSSMAQFPTPADFKKGLGAIEGVNWMAVLVPRDYQDESFKKELPGQPGRLDFKATNDALLEAAIAHAGQDYNCGIELLKKERDDRLQDVLDRMDPLEVKNVPFEGLPRKLREKNATVSIANFATVQSSKREFPTPVGTPHSERAPPWMPENPDLKQYLQGVRLARGRIIPPTSPPVDMDDSIPVVLLEGGVMRVNRLLYEKEPRELDDLRHRPGFHLDQGFNTITADVLPPYEKQARRRERFNPDMYNGVEDFERLARQTGLSQSLRPNVKRQAAQPQRRDGEPRERRPPHRGTGPEGPPFKKFRQM